MRLRVHGSAVERLGFGGASEISSGCSSCGSHVVSSGRCSLTTKEPIARRCRQLECLCFCRVSAFAPPKALEPRNPNAVTPKAES